MQLNSPAVNSDKVSSKFLELTVVNSSVSRIPVNSTNFITRVLFVLYLESPQNMFLESDAVSSFETV